MNRGRIDEAVAQFRTAVEMKPRFAEAEYELGVAAVARGQFGEAIAHYRQALSIAPDYARAHNNLGAALASCRRFDEAVGQYRQALATEPDYADAHYNLGLALAAAGRIEEAIRQYREALQIEPDYAKALNQLAWLRATCADAAFRDGEAAVAMAGRAMELGGKTPVFLDTLAAAYAEAGMFAQARQTMREAVELARLQRKAALVERLDARLRLYEAGTPYREAR